MSNLDEASETSFPDNGILYQTSTTASPQFQTAVDNFMTFIISFFSKFVINKLVFSTYHEKLRNCTKYFIEIFFFDDDHGKPYFFNIVSEDFLKDDKHFSHSLSMKIAGYMCYTLEKFTRRGYKSNGKRVFLHPDFLAKYLWEFFNLFNPEYESIFNTHDLSQKVTLYKRLEEKEQTSNYERHSITFELDDKTKYRVYNGIKEILKRINFFQFLLSEKPHEVTNEKMILRCRFLELVFSGKMFNNFNSNYIMYRDLYTRCSEEIFQRNSLKYATNTRCKFNQKKKSLSLIPPRYQNKTIISFLQLKLRTKSFGTYDLIQIILDPKIFARKKTLPLLEQYVYDTWYGEEESKNIDPMDKQVLPLEIKEMILFYI